MWVVGDSILDGGRDEVEAALADWALTLDAEVGRSSSSGVELARAAVEQDANAVVIELGTNDASAACSAPISSRRSTSWRASPS